MRSQSQRWRLLLVAASAWALCVLGCVAGCAKGGDSAPQEPLAAAPAESNTASGPVSGEEGYFAGAKQEEYKKVAVDDFKAKEPYDLAPTPKPADQPATAPMPTADKTNAEQVDRGVLLRLGKKGYGKGDKMLARGGAVRSGLLADEVVQPATSARLKAEPKPMPMKRPRRPGVVVDNSREFVMAHGSGGLGLRGPRDGSEDLFGLGEHDGKDMAKERDRAQRDRAQALERSRERTKFSGEDLGGEETEKKKHAERAAFEAELKREIATLERRSEARKSGRAYARKAMRGDGDLDLVDDESEEEAEPEEGRIVSGKTADGRYRGESRLKGWEQQRELLARYEEPDALLPRMFYFENTYLGGNAAHQERLRRLDEALAGGDRAYRWSTLPLQHFDPPTKAGLGLSASLDTTFVDPDRPQRMILQVGIKGSERYGWRRPPIDLVLVVDGGALATRRDTVGEFVLELVRRLGPQDRLGVVLAGPTVQELAPLTRPRRLRNLLAARLEGLDQGFGGDDGGPSALSRAMESAGVMLQRAAEGAGVPGTQTVLVLGADQRQDRVDVATAAAHGLSVQGVVTSVALLDQGVGGGWWAVANAGHGNFHRVADGATPADAISAELASLSRVVARLLRLNVRLGKDVGAIRVLGTRVLDQEEARQVKAREVATDRKLSQSLGIRSDRGQDDDGIQTVIPYFYGGDDHVVLIELWVERPGPVAEVTLKYKDMVGLRNATARVAVSVRGTRQPVTNEQRIVQRNTAGFLFAAELERASHRIRHGDVAGAHHHLRRAEELAAHTNDVDRRLVAHFRDVVAEGEWQHDASERSAVGEALETAGRRRVGMSLQ